MVRISFFFNLVSACQWPPVHFQAKQARYRIRRNEKRFFSNPRKTNSVPSGSESRSLPWLCFFQTFIHVSETASGSAAQRHHLFESLSNRRINVCKRCFWTTDVTEISTYSFRNSSSPTDRFGKFPELKPGTYLLFTSLVLESMLVLRGSDIESLHADPFMPPWRFRCSNLLANCYNGFLQEPENVLTNHFVIAWLSHVVTPCLITVLMVNNLKRILNLILLR